MSKKEKEITELEKKTADPNFWQDQEKATQVSQNLADLKEEIEFWQGTTLEIDELIGLNELAENDEKLRIDIFHKYKELKKSFDKQELKVFLSEKYDKHNAVLSIYSGAGGTDAQDWVEMLLRMYLRYAEKKGYKAKVLEVTAGLQAGVKNVTMIISHAYAYGYLKKETGVHRLVRLSPFNSDSLRHTSFALVEVLPEFEKLKEIEINPQDLKYDTYKASGPGGQYVNKTESAIRITHKPTNITVACQSERIQGENKKKAMKLLYTKLYQHRQKIKEKEKNKIKGKQVSVEWGSQIRSYVLHPYQMIKDHRTDVQTSQSLKVLDGDLDEFIEAQIRA